MPLRIGIVVGEPSGDLLAAELIATLKKYHSDLEVEGIVGPNLIAEGCKELYAMERLSVMGFVEPLLRLPELLKIRSWLKKYFIADPPGLFIGVDAPDFNLDLEQALHDAGIPTIHYVSPSVWAWRSGRIKKIKRAVDMMLTLFPFEAKFYEQHNVPVCFTGHPAADAISIKKNIFYAKKHFNLMRDNKLIALLPGSRNSEIKRMAKLYLEVAKLCWQQYSKYNYNLRFIVAVLYPEHRVYIENLRNKLKLELGMSLSLEVVVNDTYNVMAAADIALVTSGTATLELMLHKTPMVVAYKTNWLCYEIVKRLIKVSYIALPNLLAGEKIVPEFIQHDANAPALCKAIMNLLTTPSLCELQSNRFYQLHQELKKDASLKAAHAVNTVLGLA